MNDKQQTSIKHDASSMDDVSILRKIGLFLGQLHSKYGKDIVEPRVYVADNYPALIAARVGKGDPIITFDVGWWGNLSYLARTESWGWDYIRWTFAHEFGHKLFGKGEDLANNFAAKHLDFDMLSKTKDLHARYRQARGISLEGNSPKNPHSYRNLLFVDVAGQIFVVGENYTVVK